MRFDGQDPSLAPLENVSDRRTPAAVAPLSDRHRDHAPQSPERNDETTLVEAKSRTTDQNSHDDHGGSEGGRGEGSGTRAAAAAEEAGPTAAGAKTWHNPIFADKARGIRTRALRFVSFSFPRGRKVELQELTLDACLETSRLRRGSALRWCVFPPPALENKAQVHSNNETRGTYRAPESSTRCCSGSRGSRATPRSERSAAPSSSAT